MYYDFDARRARIDYDPVPHMPPKSFVRRYDLGHEWMVMEIQREKECQKSRLREAMPMPRYPDAFIYMGESRVRGKPCDHWREDHGEEVVEMDFRADGSRGGGWNDQNKMGEAGHSSYNGADGSGYFGSELIRF